MANLILLSARRWGYLPGKNPPRKTKTKKGPWTDTVVLAEILKDFGPHEINCTTGVSKRQIYRIKHCEYSKTSLWVADRILTKMGLGHKLTDGTVRIFD